MDTGLIGPRWWWHKNAVRLKWWDESSDVLFYANTIEVILWGAILVVALMAFFTLCHRLRTGRWIELPNIWPD